MTETSFQDDHPRPLAPESAHERAERYRLHEQIGTVLRVANQNAVDVFNQVVAASFGDGQVTTTQFAVLSTLWQHGPLTHTQIAQFTAVDLPTLHSLLQRLQKKDYIETGHDPDDRRRRVVQLTGRGEEFALQLRAIGEQISETILEPLSKTEQRQLLALLHKFNAARLSPESE